MNPETGVYALLTNTPALTALVGDRIYPVMLPQTVVVPALVVTQLDEQEEITKDGPVSNGWTFQVTVIAANNDQARQVSRIVKTALNWKTATLGTGENIRTRFEDESDASWEPEQRYFQIVQDFKARKT